MRKLGKGLSELGLNELLNAGAESPEPAINQLQYLPVDKIFPSSYQPRKYIDPEALEELANSIRAQGVIQPIIVKLKAGQHYENHYEIIAGERRWRAAKLAGLHKIPAIIREISEQTAVAFALIENIQRRDLNAIEEAQALQRLLNEFNLTHEAIAQAVGKSRATISNLLRLLELDPDVIDLLSSGQIQMGHARALLVLQSSTQKELGQIVKDKGLSVRQTEMLVRNYQHPAAVKKTVDFSKKHFSEKLKTPVSVVQNAKGRGKIVINYHDSEKLAEILALLSC